MCGVQVTRCGHSELVTSGITMGGDARGARAPPPPIQCLCPPLPPVAPPIHNFEKIDPHLILQDTKCSSIDMPPLEKLVHSLVVVRPPPPLKIGP